MYKYVPSTHINHYKAYCQDILDQLQKKLRKEYSIRMHSVLIGSGATNMVTKNGKAGFDLEYNLILTSVPRRLDRSPGEIKDIIRKTLEELIQDKYSDEQGCASSITYRLHSLNGKRAEFCFDISIIRKHFQVRNKCRLVWNEEQGGLVWEQIPASSKQDSKVAAIKRTGHWEKVRRRYLDRKNRRLLSQDYSQPSYAIYNETVNHVFQSIKGL